MAIKHVIAHGFGFADGTIFIPTLGFTASAAVEHDLAGTISATPVLSGSITVGGLWEAALAPGGTWTPASAPGGTWTVQ